jgi:rRNA maturation RNase YbeY
VSRSPARQIDIIEEFDDIDVSIDVSVDASVDVSVDVSEDWLNTVMQQAMRVALDQDQAGQVSLLLTDDATVRDLNRKFRGLDEVTDVLSFSTDFPGHWEGPGEPEDKAPTGHQVSENLPFILPPNQVPPLGEVIVSYPQAQRQASEKGHELKVELALLIVHGVLHLVGHDHLEAQDTALMQAKENMALQSIFQPGAAAP